MSNNSFFHTYIQNTYIHVGSVLQWWLLWLFQDIYTYLLHTYTHTYIYTLIYRTYMQVTPDANPINPRKFREEALKRFHDQLSEYIRPKEEG